MLRSYSKTLTNGIGFLIREACCGGCLLFPPWEEAEKASFKGDQPSPDSKSVVALIMGSEASRAAVNGVTSLRTFSGGWRDDPVVQSPCCSSKAPGFGSSTPIRQLPTTCNSSSSSSGTFFWPCRQKHANGAHTYAQAQVGTHKINL